VHSRAQLEFNDEDDLSCVITAALLATSSLAAAQMPAMPPMPPAAAYPQMPWYIGAGVGGGHLNRSPSDLAGLNNAQLDDNDTTYTIRGGWRFSPYGALELGYYDLGRYDFTGTAVGNAVPVNGSAKAKSVGISLVGILPLYNFDLYGRIGFAHSELKFNGNTRFATGNNNERQSEATYGVGARWWFMPNWALFGEWVKNDRIRVDSYLGGIDFRF
jgi:OOP family OmpA-OmpF porin